MIVICQPYSLKPKPYKGQDIEEHRIQTNRITPHDLHVCQGILHLQRLHHHSHQYLLILTVSALRGTSGNYDFVLGVKILAVKSSFVWGGAEELLFAPAGFFRFCLQVFSACKCSAVLYSPSLCWVWGRPAGEVGGMMAAIEIMRLIRTRIMLGIMSFLQKTRGTWVAALPSFRLL